MGKLGDRSASSDRTRTLAFDAKKPLRFVRLAAVGPSGFEMVGGQFSSEGELEMKT